VIGVFMPPEQQLVYFKDTNDNFYRLEVVEGNIFSGARFNVFQKVKSDWVSLGERVSNSGIKKGRPLWGVITVGSYMVQNPI
jgi:hypothetical protein